MSGPLGGVAKVEGPGLDWSCALLGMARDKVGRLDQGGALPLMPASAHLSARAHERRICAAIQTNASCSVSWALPPLSQSAAPGGGLLVAEEDIFCSAAE